MSSSDVHKLPTLMIMLTWWFIGFSIILGITSILFTTKYYKLKKEQIFKKRYGWITLMISCCSVWLLLLSWPLILICTIFKISQLSIALPILTSPIVYILAFLVVLRYWYIYTCIHMCFILAVSMDHSNINIFVCAYIITGQYRLILN